MGRIPTRHRTRHVLITWTSLKVDHKDGYISPPTEPIESFNDRLYLPKRGNPEVGTPAIHIY